MSAPYDMSFMNSTNPVDVMVTVNNNTGGMIGAGACLVLYYVIMKGAIDNNYSIGKALLTASTILSIITGIMLRVGILPGWVVGVNIAVLIGSIFLVIFGDK